MWRAHEEERKNYVGLCRCNAINLSNEFKASINELVAGERLNDDDFKKVAETNLVSALENSTFTAKEKALYFKKKWRKEHVWSIIISAIVWICIIIALKFQDVETALCGASGGILASLFYIVLYNRMMAYVEKHVYTRPSENESKEKEWRNS